MFFIFLSFFLSSIYFLLIGSLSSKALFNININEKKNYYEFALIGIIIASIIAFILNFFVSLNRYVNDLLFIIPFLIFLLNNKLKIDLNFKKVLKISLIVAVISTILISYDNVYRPDAGSYHLPFISILNDNKIILGLSNLHFRFGHISIIQYLSASFNNHLFLDNGILIPGGLIFSFIIFYFYKIIYYEKNNLINLITIIFLIFIVFRMNRYSSFGNDAPAHFYFMYLIILTLKYKNYIGDYNNFFNKICLIGVFIFFNKITMLLALVIPIYFIFNKNFLKIYKNKIFLLIILIFLSWLGKNIITSGCAAFPLEQTCFKSLQWFDKSDTRRSNAVSGRIENEAWTKGYPNQTEKNFEEYISSFEWFDIWKEYHGKKIIKKLTPFLIFLLIVIIFLFFNEKRQKFKFLEKEDKILWFLIFLNLFGSLLWFFKFPVFRYGYGYLIGFFGILVTMFLSSLYKVNTINLKKKLNIILIICFFGLLSKYSVRMYQNYELAKSPWPVIYSDNSKIIKNKMTPHYQNGKLILYTPELSMCYYSDLSPCTNMANNEFNISDIKMDFIMGYKKYYFVK
tara:strand:+ start:3846 stop:5555 length:1710 start_codon:yes stop_codon:yes gene_type:complete